MSLILDTGVVYAWYDRDDRWHDRVRALIDEERGALILPASVIPEVDYLLERAIGVEAQLAFYEDLNSPVYRVVDLPTEQYLRVESLNREHADLRLGFVDAAVMATAENLGIGRIGTTDRRDFGAVTLGVPIELLP